MCRKRMEPFKCDYVPKDRLIMFMHKNSNLWQRCFEDYEKYLLVLKEYPWNIRRYQLDAARKKYVTKKNPFVEALYAMIQLEFNYMDSTVAGGGILSRMVRIHKGLKTL